MTTLATLLRHPQVQGLSFLAALVLGWEVAADVGVLRPYQFPAPSRVVEAVWEIATSGFPEGVKLTTHGLVTLGRILQGFLLAITLAIPLGLLIGWFPVLDRMTLPVITFARSVATLSLLPLAIVWFGTGELSKVLLIAYGCFWVMLGNVVAGVKYVDPVLIRAARTMDASGLVLFRRVVLPAALPRILTGARVSLGVGFMVIVGAEMIGTIRGLGALIMEARTFYRADISLAGIAALGLLGFGFAIGLGALERKLLPWHRGLEDVRR
ncbi:MAG: ABC transporter permease [Proteobacteria bacterium]|nr:ABC transporter permease [Pseudomonadota bacterium]